MLVVRRNPVRFRDSAGKVKRDGDPSTSDESLTGYTSPVMVSAAFIREIKKPRINWPVCGCSLERIIKQPTIDTPHDVESVWRWQYWTVITSGVPLPTIQEAMLPSNNGCSWSHSQKTKYLKFQLRSLLRAE